MASPGRCQIVYVTADSTRWLIVNVPSGLIPPPSLQIGWPLHGLLDFYYAECHKLRIPAEAKRALRGQ